MKKFDVKEHTNKYMNMAKDARNGTYPDKRSAKIGSKIGLGIGVVLCCIGIYVMRKSTVGGMGSLVAGVLTIISNMINLKRLQSK